MFERFDEKARNALFQATRIALSEECRRIEPRHLLIAMLTSDVKLRELMKHFGADPYPIFRVLRPPPETGPELPFSHDTKIVLRNAAQESEGLGDQYIGTEHLLLGLLSEGQSDAAATLINLGMTAQGMREHLATLVRPDNGDPWT